jgi:hypothetical protein
VLYCSSSLLNEKAELLPVAPKNTDISTTKIYLDISILTKSIIGRREYEEFECWNLKSSCSESVRRKEKL